MRHAFESATDRRFFEFMQQQPDVQAEIVQHYQDTIAQIEAIEQRQADDRPDDLANARADILRETPRHNLNPPGMSTMRSKEDVERLAGMRVDKANREEIERVVADRSEQIDRMLGINQSDHQQAAAPSKEEGIGFVWTPEMMNELAAAHAAEKENVNSAGLDRDDD